MRNIIIAALLSLAFGNMAHAQDTENKMERCSFISKTALRIMISRQVGTHINDVIDVYAGVYGDDPDFMKLVEFLSLQAYKQPKYKMRDNQQEAINEFSNKYFVYCMEGQ